MRALGRYETDSNQELLALGLANIAGSFFGSYPIAGSLSRSALVSTTAGPTCTPMHGVITAGMVLLVLVLLTGTFRPMPNAVLASIVFMAVRIHACVAPHRPVGACVSTPTGVDMPCACTRAHARPRPSARSPPQVKSLFDISRARFLYRVKRSDFVAWCTAFCATLLLGVKLGIAVGAAAARAQCRHRPPPSHGLHPSCPPSPSRPLPRARRRWASARRWS